MHLIPLMLLAAAVLAPRPAAAQEWIEYVSRDDFFSINFPVQPRIQETTWVSEQGATFPARVYSAQLGRSRFSVTVVDYRSLEKILTAKSKSCPAGAETCLGGAGARSSTGAGYWKADYAGALIYATRQFMTRDASVTEFVWTNIDLVEGHLLHLTNKDQSRTYAMVLMHADRLYITEATVPAGDPEPGLFQQALGFVDTNGDSIRYQTLYHHGQPVPQRGR
jgi:hypothetical protein